MLHHRIIVGSKIDRVCFDKTGTLTEDGLKISGVIAFDPANNIPYTITSGKDLCKLTPELFQLMATCHSLRHFAGRLVGDPLDVEMFTFTDLALPNHYNGQVDIPVFSSNLRKVQSSLNFGTDRDYFSVFSALKLNGNMNFHLNFVE